MSSRPLPSPAPCIQTLPCSPKPGAPLQEGWMGGAHALSGWPPQKLTGSEFLNRRRSPAWRLNSALRASNNAARTCGRSSPVQKQETAQFFHRPAGKGIRPSPLSFPQRHAGSPDRGRACTQGDGTWRPRQNNTKIKQENTVYGVADFL